MGKLEYTQDMVRLIIRAENLLILVGSVLAYRELGGSLLMFVLLILIPDVSMIGYLKDKRLGAMTYNLLHNYLIATLIIAVGFLVENLFISSIGLILSSHVSLDRVLGFGLKYPESFKGTHIQKL